MVSMLSHAANAAAAKLAVVRLAPISYAITNILLIGLIVALAAQSPFIWLVLGASIIIGGPLDDLAGELRSSAGPKARLFYQAILYAALPLLLIVTVLYMRVIADRTISSAPYITNFADLTVVLGACVATGYFYALAGETVAHELVHRKNTLSRFFARALLALPLNVGFESYHILVHHRHVATKKDPSTARRGEYILVFIARTIIVQFVTGYTSELRRLRIKHVSSFSLHNSVLFCSLCSIVIGGSAFFIAGWLGVIGYLASAILGRFIHECVNYLQHYGLVRLEGCPVQPRHAWDTYRRLSSVMQYNLSRHSDHHLSMAKPFWDLKPVVDAPQLPHGYGTMIMMAFIPPLWRRAIDPLLLDWDRRLASAGELALIRQQKLEPQNLSQMPL
jgi:fatty acid desaturase